mmetsp:Transcript_42662/g.91518  ORF Transcript_42662/g.91518 Transcript_42662/m.91518 type:complete len:91 (+) Transcript_42662:80-352(+)
MQAQKPAGHLASKTDSTTRKESGHGPWGMEAGEMGGMGHGAWGIGLETPLLPLAPCLHLRLQHRTLSVARKTQDQHSPTATMKVEMRVGG